MADKIINTRLLLKIDSLTNWQASTLPLKKGEVAFATVAASEGTGLSEPVIMMKVANEDGKTFKELPWAFHAKASDVVSACKSEESLKTFINGVIADAGIASSDAMEALAGRVTAVEGGVAALEDLVGEKAVATQISEAIAALKLGETYELKGANDEVIAGIQEDIGGIETKIGVVPEGKDIVTMISDAQSAATYDDSALSGRVSAIEGDYLKSGDKTELEGKITAEKERAEGVEAGLESRLVAVEGYDHAADVQSAKNYTDEQIEALGIGNYAKTTEVNGAISTAKGEAIAEAKAYTDEVKAGILGEGLTETFDTLKEIEDWINGAGVNATELSAAIADEAKLRGDADSALSGRLDVLEEIDHSAYIAADTALKSELEGKIGAIDNHSHSNKALLDTYTQTEANLADAVAKKHAHTFVESELNKIKDGDVAKWNAAEQNSRDYTDEQIEGLGIGSYVKKTDADTYYAAINHNHDEDYDAKGSAASVQSALDAYIASNNAEVVKKANDADLAAVAKSGLIDDLSVGEGTVLIFDCGDSVA